MHGAGHGSEVAWLLSVHRLLPLLIAVLAVLAPRPAFAQEITRRLGEPVDSWSEPNPGVRYLHRTYDAPPVAVHALVVDLSRARIVATPERDRWSSVSSFADANEAAAAINGGFWGLWQRPCGITAGGGERWESGEPDPEFGHFGVRRDGRAVVNGPGEGEDASALARLGEAVSGRPILLRRGELDTETLDAFETSNLRQPRTAVGVSRDGRTAYLVVVDGRQGHSVGFTLYQLARTLEELGAWRAINLDGGGSSAMYVREAGGLVSSPARGRWTRRLGIGDPSERERVRRRGGEREVYVRGVEREVMNQLAVIADPPESRVAVRSGDILLDGLPPAPRLATFGPAAPIRIGRVREWLVPAASLLAPLFGLGALFALGRRLSSWRAARRARRSAARTPSRSSRTSCGSASRRP